MKKIIFLVLSSVYIMSCAPEESGFTIAVTVDGATQTFECNRNAYAGGGNEYSIGCSRGNSARLNFVKGYDANAASGVGLVTVTYTDVPNTAFFDSGYGIHYSCDTNAVTTQYEPYCIGSQPMLDSATSTLTLDSVILTAGTNNTGIIESYVGEPDIGDGNFVQGDDSKTISATIVLDDVPYFQ